MLYIIIIKFIVLRDYLFINFITSTNNDETIVIFRANKENNTSCFNQNSVVSGQLGVGQSPPTMTTRNIVSSSVDIFSKYYILYFYENSNFSFLYLI